MMLATLLFTRLRSHIGRSLVLVAVIAVASGVAIGALSVLHVTQDPWAPLVRATNGADVEIDEAPARPDPRRLAALPEVQYVGSLIETGDTALQLGDEALLVALRRMPNRETMPMDKPSMIAGRWYQSNNEVVFEATMADTLGIDIGDRVTLVGQRSHTVRVVGTAATTMMPNFPERVPGSVFAGSGLYDAIDPVGKARWTIGLRLRDPAQADAVAARINAGGPVPSGTCQAAGWCARTADNIRANAFPGRADEFAQIMLFFAVLMLIASVLLIVTLLGSRLVSEARELTLLQVAGVTPARLGLLIAAEHAVLAVVGVAAGTAIATAVAPRITESAATVFGSVSPHLSLADVFVVAAIAVAGSAFVSGLGGWRAGRRSLAIIARGGSGRVHRSRAAALAMASTPRATLVLGLKDIATRRGRMIAILLSVGLAVTIAITIIGIGAMTVVDPTATAGPSSGLPANPADISHLSPLPSAVNDETMDRILTLITTLQVLLGAVALITLLAAASMSVRERLRELGVLHALGCTTPQLVGASAVSHGFLGMLGTVIGLPLGLGLYLLFKLAGGGAFEGLPPIGGIAAVVVAAVAVSAASAALPALLAQRVQTSEALAAE